MAHTGGVGGGVDARRLERDGWCFVVSAPPGSASSRHAYVQVLDAAEGASRALGAGAPHAVMWVPMPQGWSGELRDVDDPSEAIAWFDAFTQRLGSGTEISRRPRERLPRHVDPSPTLSLGVAYATSTPPIPRPLPGLLADFDPTPPDAGIVQAALDWVQLPDAPGYLYYEFETHETAGPPPAQSLADMIREGLTSYQAVLTKPVRHRHVTFQPDGMVTYQNVDRRLTMRENLDDLADLLRTSNPARIDYAFMAFEDGGDSTVWMADYLHYQLPNGLSEPTSATTDGS